jgi:hypothetical protein
MTTSPTQCGSADNDNLLFFEARLEVTSDKQSLSGFVYLKRAGNNGSDWLPTSTAVVRIGFRTMCPAVSGDIRLRPAHTFIHWLTPCFTKLGCSYHE